MRLCVLGRQPYLGIAELESILGPDLVRPFGKGFAITRGNDKAIKQENLGGTIKIGEVIAIIRQTELHLMEREVMEILERHAIPKTGNTDHKLNIGISAYNVGADEKAVRDLLFKFKDRLEKKHISTRVISPKGTVLNSAQVQHNKLMGPSGSEFIIAGDERETCIARTISVQNITSYSKRDYDRPGRDIVTGMLPPKLAQIMLNLGSVKRDTTVLDPFCGTGVVLMEAALTGAVVTGSDINPKMVSMTKENLSWLSKEFNVDTAQANVMCADATTSTWKPMPEKVVSETYLGPPLHSLPKPHELENIVKECDRIVENFLVNLRPQLRPESRCCIAVPMWNTRKGLIQLPIVDNIKELGYSRVWFSHVRPGQLIYRRPDQVVARQLLVLVPRYDKNRKRY